MVNGVHFRERESVREREREREKGQRANDKF